MIIQHNNDNDDMIFDIYQNGNHFAHTEFNIADIDFVIISFASFIVDIRPKLLNLTKQKILSIEHNNHYWSRCKVSLSGKTLIVEGCWDNIYACGFYDLTCLNDPNCEGISVIKNDRNAYLEITDTWYENYEDTEWYNLFK